VPEVLTLVLRPKGAYRVPGAHALDSRLNWTRFQISWNVVEVWNLSATNLLNAGDLGLLPWLPLTQIDGRPEVMFQQCRERIDREATPEERATLLAVMQVFLRVRYNDPRYFAIFGGYQTMIESPLIQEIEDA